MALHRGRGARQPFFFVRGTRSAEWQNSPTWFERRVADSGAPAPRTHDFGRKAARFYEALTLLFREGMEYDKAKIDALRGQIIGCAIEVHRALGPGLLESVYQTCLIIELRAAGLEVEVNQRIPLRYRGRIIDPSLYLDLLVNGLIVVEAKSVARLHPVHTAQVITYLKLADKPAGLLLNFNCVLMKDGIRRVTHPTIIDPDLPKRHIARLT